MRAKLPKRVYWTAYGVVSSAFVLLLVFYVALTLTHQEIPKDVPVWLDRLLSAFIGIVVVPREDYKDVPPPGPDTDTSAHTEGSSP